MTNLEKFVELYAVALKEAVEKYPHEYSWSVENVPTVVERMKGAFIAGGYNKDSRAIKSVCKQLGLQHTYRAINAHLKGK